MRFLALMTSMTCALVLLAAPAFAASMAAHDDCDADNNPDRNIAGCTLIIEDASEGDTMHAVAHVARGLAWQAKGDLDRALADYTEAIRLNPRDALAYNNRGLLWREKGDVDRAIADLTDAIRIDPLPHSDIARSGHVNIYANRGLAWQSKGDLGARHRRLRSSRQTRSKRRRRLKPARRRAPRRRTSRSGYG